MAIKTSTANRAIVIAGDGPGADRHHGGWRGSRPLTSNLLKSMPAITVCRDDMGAYRNSGSNRRDVVASRSAELAARRRAAPKYQ